QAVTAAQKAGSERRSAHRLGTLVSHHYRRWAGCDARSQGFGGVGPGRNKNYRPRSCQADTPDCLAVTGPEPDSDHVKRTPEYRRVEESAEAELMAGKEGR